MATPARSGRGQVNVVVKSHLGVWSGFHAPDGCVGRCRWDGSGVLLFEVSVGCSHVCASWQSVARCSCRLREVLAEEAVFRPFGKL